MMSVVRKNARGGARAATVSSMRASLATVPIATVPVATVPVATVPLATAPLATVLLATASLLGAVSLASAQAPADRAPPSGEVSLAAVLAWADDNAPAIVVARARQREGEAARRGADRPLPDPLSLTVAGGPRLTDAGSADWDAQFTAQQSFEVGGQHGARVRAARGLETQREAELEVVRWEVHRLVHFAFHEAVEARARLAAEDRWLALAQDLLRIALAREAAGDIAALDVELAHTELASAQQRHARVESLLTDARLSVAELAGWPADDPPMPAGDLDPPHSIPSDAALVAMALEIHPALRAQAARLAQLQSRIDAEEAETTPPLEVGFSLSREGSAGSPANYIGLLTLGTRFFLDGQPNATRILEARAEREVAEAQAHAMLQVVEARVRRAAAAVRASSLRVSIHRQDVLPRQLRILELLRSAFEVGEIGVLELSVARERMLALEAEALDALAAYHTALADLEAQVGTEVVEDEAHAAPDIVEDEAHAAPDVVEDEAHAAPEADAAQEVTP